MIYFQSSCGGVIGNVEKYRFNEISIKLLKKAVSDVYTIHPEFKDFDTVKYKEGKGIGDGDYYCRIKVSENDYFFRYAFPQYPPPNDTIVEIALTSAGIYGNNLVLAKDISQSDKVKYGKIFEHYFIEAVRSELKRGN